MTRTVITTTYGCNPRACIVFVWMAAIVAAIVTHAAGLW